VDADLSRAVWHKSTRSNGSGGACVEVADNLPGIVAVRDSKDREGGALTFSREQWRAFIIGARDGQFATCNRAGCTKCLRCGAAIF
jgi:Domain of unknown function (DUF397)